MTIYVLHLDPPLKHARHYTGYTPDKKADRRIKEHLDGKGSPLIKAALAAGSKVTVAKVFKGQGRDFERWIKTRRDIRSWCPCCGVKKKPIPRPENMSASFKAKKRSHETLHHMSLPQCEAVDNGLPF